MKKTKLLSLLLSFFIISSILSPGAYASSSEIVDSMSVNAGAALLVDLDTDTVLFGQDQDKVIYPASTTKVLTALIVLQQIEAGELSLNTTVTCSNTFRKTLTYDAAVVNLQPGEQMSVESLLYCLLLPSACDAANVLGEAVSGDLESFAQEMNDTAAELGCTSSHFVNPSGLHDNDHYTTCSDLYLIMKAALQYDEFRKIIATPSITLPATNVSEPRSLQNTNALLTGTKTTTYNYPDCIGGKTGSTYLAGYCLISAAQRDGKTLVCIMMGCNWLINLDGSRDRLQFSESVRLFDWGFESFTTKEIVEKDAVLGSVPVTLSDEGDHVDAIAVQSISAELPIDVDASDFEITLDCPSEIEAPVFPGDSLGTATVSLDGVEYGCVELAASQGLALSPEIQRERERQAWLEANRDNLRLAIILTALLLLLFLLLALRGHSRKKHRKKSHKVSQTTGKSTKTTHRSSSSSQKKSRTQHTSSRRR